MKKPPPVVDLLRCVPGLKGLSDRALSEVAPLVDEVAVEPGFVLTREGIIGDEAFVIIEGEGEVFIDGETVATVGPGEFVGEMAMLDHQPRSATVRAKTPIRALVIGPRAFSTFVGTGTVAQAIAFQLSRRLRNADAS